MSMKMNKGILITVRTNSVRLPQKALVEFSEGLMTIEYLIDRIKFSENADKIILCTTNNIEDNILIEIAKKYNIDYFRGSEKDKLVRWKDASDKFDIEFIVTADGDDLFIDPKLIDISFDQLENGNADFIHSTGIICGSFTYALRRSALQKVCQIKNTTDTEMMWVYFTDTGIFNVEELKNVPSNYFRHDIRMTLDYPEDLDFFKTVISKSKNKNKYLTLNEIINVIDNNPSIKNINYFRQNDFLINQKTKTNLQIKDVFHEKS